MFYLRVLGALSIIFALAGCDLLKPFKRDTADYPWADLQCGVTVDNKAKGACTAEEAQALAMQVTAGKFCREVHNRYESGANQAGYAQWLVSATGTAAGLFALSSHGTATKVWAGLAGSTNAMQLAMNNAISATAELQRQSAVARAAREAEKDLIAATTPQERQRLAIRMTNECWMASASAEAKILDAINQLALNGGTKPPDAKDPPNPGTPGTAGTPGTPTASTTPAAPGTTTRSPGTATGPNTSSAPGAIAARNAAPPAGRAVSRAAGTGEAPPTGARDRVKAPAAAASAPR